MRHVTIALLPAAACAPYFFGIGALIVIATSIAACAATEYIINRWMLRRPSTLADGSAILTGLLLAFNLPSNLPVWAVIIGSVVAIGIGKMAFGGLGCNIWNPALVGRVFLLISFPVQMTSWRLPLVNRSEYFDAVTGATTLGILKLGEADSASIDILASATGAIGGSLGEVSAIALLIGFIYLLCMKVITWHIPVSILGTVALFALCMEGNLAVERSDARGVLYGNRLCHLTHVEKGHAYIRRHDRPDNSHNTPLGGLPGRSIFCHTAHERFRTAHRPIYKTT